MKGKLLIATPNLLTDGIFSQSVILIADRHSDGTVGFMLNKPFRARLNDVTQIPLAFPIYNGGPVEQDKLYYIHRIPDIVTGSLPIGDGLYWGGDLKNIINGLYDETFLSDKIKFFAGYSGWSKGQLEDEIEDEAWFVAPLDFDPITALSKDMWKTLLVKIRPDLTLWKDAPSDPALN
ncbi:MAG: YqgE/AlgH family protein [Chlorobi bacterium]|nr:YqgE/AlgH family protein [Chlorobiota bacterium]